MRTFISNIVPNMGKPFEWHQPNFLKMEYELKSEQGLYATLRFRSSWGTFATAECAQGCWTFKRSGFWQTRVTIRACDSEAEVASFKNNTWSDGGTLAFSDGRVYRANTNFWQTQYEFQTETGESLIHYRHGGLIHPSAQVTISQAAQDIPELGWMVIFGWYLIVMMQNDSSTAVVAATTVM